MRLLYLLVIQKKTKKLDSLYSRMLSGNTKILIMTMFKPLKSLSKQILNELNKIQDGEKLHTTDG